MDTILSKKQMTEEDIKLRFIRKGNKMGLVIMQVSDWQINSTFRGQ